MMTVKRMFMFLFRITIVWPSMLTGCVMMLYSRRSPAVVWRDWSSVTGWNPPAGVMRRKGW